MKLEKAIEISEITLNDEFTTLHHDQLDALKLGIEALKWRSLMENDYGSRYFPPLPGETKD